MPDFRLSFQEEVRRLARKEAKAFNETFAAQQKTIRALPKRVAELEKSLNVSIASSSAKEEKAADLQVPAKSGKVRFSPKSLLKFRKKYGISQKAVAAILDVTVFTVSHWELGKNRPKEKQIEAIGTLTKSGKRKIEALLAEKAPEEFAAMKAAAQKKAAKGAKKAKKAGKDKDAADLNQLFDQIFTVTTEKN